MFKQKLIQSWTNNESSNLVKRAKNYVAKVNMSQVNKIWVGCALPLCWLLSPGWCFSSGWVAQSLWLTLCRSSGNQNENKMELNWWQTVINLLHSSGIYHSKDQQQHILTHNTPTNLRSRGDTEAAVSTDLWLFLLCICHLGTLLFGSFRPCRPDMIIITSSYLGLH